MATNLQHVVTQHFTNISFRRKLNAYLNMKTKHVLFCMNKLYEQNINITQKHVK